MNRRLPPTHDGGGVVRRQADRRIPVEDEIGARRRLRRHVRPLIRRRGRRRGRRRWLPDAIAHRVARDDARRLAGRQVVALDAGVLRLGVEDRSGRSGRSAFWNPSPPPTLIQFHMWMPPDPRRAGPAPGAVVLQARAHVSTGAACRPTRGRPAPRPRAAAIPSCRAASQVTSTPPSLPYITWLLLSGSIQIAWLSTWPMLPRPPCGEIGLQLLPPSVDLDGVTPPM